MKYYLVTHETETVDPFIVTGETMPELSEKLLRALQTTLDAESVHLNELQQLYEFLNGEDYEGKDFGYSYEINGELPFTSILTIRSISIY